MSNHPILQDKGKASALAVSPPTSVFLNLPLSPPCRAEAQRRQVNQIVSHLQKIFKNLPIL